MILHGHYMLYEQTKAKSNYSVIKSMIENKQLRPMTRKELEYAITLASKKLSHDMGFWHASRPIIIPDPKPLRQGLTPASHGKHIIMLRGYGVSNDTPQHLNQNPGSGQHSFFSKFIRPQDFIINLRVRAKMLTRVSKIVFLKLFIDKRDFLRDMRFFSN
jgi:hypothetical protein